MKRMPKRGCGYLKTFKKPYINYPVFFIGLFLFYLIYDFIKIDNVRLGYNLMQALWITGVFVIINWLFPNFFKTKNNKEK